jgi:pimeloyl-ACP methyl ester carboxylesterase
MQKRIKSFDGTNIIYEVSYGENKKDFLIFVHGVGSNLKIWKKIRLYFHKLKIPTIAIDLRGHGKSGRPKSLEDYNLQNFARDIKEIIKKEHISNPVLIGHSMGGMVVLEFQKLYPNLAKKYIIISSSYKTPKKLRTIFNKISSLIIFLNKKLESINPPSIGNYGPMNPFFSNKDVHFGRIFRDMKKTSFKSWLFSLENINQFNEFGILHTILQPVLILSGGKDNIIDVANSKKLHRFIEKSELKIFPNKNHLIILTNPKEVSEEIYSFIQKK